MQRAPTGLHHATCGVQAEGWPPAFALVFDEVPTRDTTVLRGI